MYALFSSMKTFEFSIYLQLQEIFQHIRPDSELEERPSTFDFQHMARKALSIGVI
jgi:hypothetical protein